MDPMAPPQVAQLPKVRSRHSFEVAVLEQKVALVRSAQAHCLQPSAVHSVDVLAFATPQEDSPLAGDEGVLWLSRWVFHQADLTAKVLQVKHSS